MSRVNEKTNKPTIEKLKYMPPQINSLEAVIYLNKIGQGSDQPQVDLGFS